MSENHSQASSGEYNKSFTCHFIAIYDKKKVYAKLKLDLQTQPSLRKHQTHSSFASCKIVGFLQGHHKTYVFRVYSL